MSGTFIEVIKHSEQKNELWQWDTGRQIKITPKENAIVDEVHFSNAYSKDALVVNPQVNEQGSIVADIPNILLWQVFPINVYVVMDFPNGKGTIYEEQLKINSRKKPSDYIYTETEVRNYEALEERIKTLEENGTGGGGGITKETDPTVPQWAKEPTKPSYTAGEVGALPSDTKIPDKTSDLENDSGFVTKDGVEEVEKKLTKLSEEIADLPEFEKDDTADGLTIKDSKGNIGVQLGSKKVIESFPYNKKYGWGGFPYGNGALPPFSRLAGVFEADMLSVCGGKGRWNGDDTENFAHGGHLFEGWNKEEDVRLTAGIGTTNKNIAWLQTFHPATEEGTNNGAYYGITKVGSDLDGEGCNFMPKVTNVQNTFVLWSRPTAYTPTIPEEQLNMLVDSGEIPSNIVNRVDMMILGGMYYDTTLDRVRVYTKTGWKSLAFEEE